MSLLSGKPPQKPQPMPPWLKWGLVVFVVLGLGLRMAGIGTPPPQGKPGQPQNNALHWKMPSLESYKQQLMPGYGRLQMADSVTGKGLGAFCGEDVSIRYSAQLVSSMKPADKKPDMQPLSFRLGGKDAPDMLQESVVGMREGGKRETVVPAERSSDGQPYRYDIEMLKITPAFQNTEKGALGPRVFERTIGLGRIINCGDQVNAELKIWDMSGRKLLDTFEKNAPVPLTPGSGLAMAGLEASIPGMRADGSRTLIIPPALQKPLRPPEKGANPQPGALAGLTLPEGEFIVIDVDLVP